MLRRPTLAFALALVGACGTHPTHFGWVDLTVLDADDTDSTADVGPDDTGRRFDTGVDTERDTLGPPDDIIEPPPDTAPWDTVPPDTTPWDVVPPDTPIAREICASRSDEDGDGLVDCADPDCQWISPCSPSEACADLFDNDGDGRIDCDDPDCAGTPTCAPPPTENCTNRTDDDGDGAVDCDDSDCADLDICRPPPEPETQCTDGRDNDGNGAIDCADRNCSTSDPHCGWTERCTDGYDNDGDGAFDCDDPDCGAHILCIDPGESNCINGVDDDSDGLTDCRDDDCARHDSCVGAGVPEICDNDRDDDSDDRVDCADSECFDAPICLDVGNCTDEDIAEVSGVDYSTLLAECGVPCLGSDARACVRECVAERTGISVACADCFGGLAACGSTVCLSSCIVDPGGAECIGCFLTSCGDDFSLCAGFAL